MLNARSDCVFQVLFFNAVSIVCDVGARGKEGAKTQEESRKKWQKERSKAKKKRKAAEERDAATAGGERPA